MSRLHLIGLQVEAQDQDRAATQRELAAERTVRSAAEFRVAAQFSEIKFLRACLDETLSVLSGDEDGGDYNLVEAPELARRRMDEISTLDGQLGMLCQLAEVATPHGIEDGIRRIKSERDGLFRSNADAAVVLGAAVGESLREASIRVMNELLAARRQVTESGIELANATTLLRQTMFQQTGAGLSPAEVRS